MKISEGSTHTEEAAELKVCCGAGDGVTGAEKGSMEGFVDVGPDPASVEVPVWTDQSGQLSKSPPRR